MLHKDRGSSLSGKDSSNLIREYLETLDCPRSLTCWILFNSGDKESLVQLVNLVCDPSHYCLVGDFRSAYAATKFLAKTKGLKTGIDTAGVAYEAAVEAERRCSQTNSYLELLWHSHLDESRSTLISRVIEKVALILGPVPDLQSLEGGWSRGRTTACSGPTLSPYEKYQGRLDVTASALRYAVRELRDSPWWGSAVFDADGPVSALKEAFTITKGNVMLTVPKNAKTDRVICYEPQMNIWLQLKVGRHIRSRLSRFGVNLDDQNVNRRRALLGSKTGHLATIDLKSASDTVARGLVEKLLPIDWVCLLNDLRSHDTLWPDGEWRRNSKFSSMGNGFTFELESLLFYAICKAITPNVSVYGDDIIVPTSSVSDCIRALDMFGFWVNVQKSFADGPFRESCGMDAFLGSSCTPVYLRSIPKSTEDVVNLHNRVLEFAQSYGLTPWSTFGRLLRKWRKRFPSFLGPQGQGDGHYHVNLDEACPSRARFWVEGWWFDTLVREYRGGVASTEITRRVGSYRLTGNFGNAGAALCAATGPKRVYSLYDSSLDRRKFRIKRIRALASSWPETLWD
jgi:hypothetical protein